jgi:hypothetical protein
MVTENAIDPNGLWWTRFIYFERKSCYVVRFGEGAATDGEYDIDGSVVNEKVQKRRTTLHAGLRNSKRKKV